MSEAIDAVTAFNQQQCVVNGGGGGTPGTPTGIPCSDSQGDLASPGTQAFLQRLGIYHSEQLRGIDLVSEVQLLVGHLPILLRKALLSRFRRIFVPKGF